MCPFSVQSAGNLDPQLLSVSLVQVLRGAAGRGQRGAPPRRLQHPRQDPARPQPRDPAAAPAGGLHRRGPRPARTRSPSACEETGIIMNITISCLVVVVVAVIVVVVV